MSTYCVKQRKKKTQCVPSSETVVVTKNNRHALKCKCAECGITKFKCIKNSPNKTTQFTLTFFQKYFILTTTVNIDQ